MNAIMMEIHIYKLDDRVKPSFGNLAQGLGTYIDYPLTPNRNMQASWDNKCSIHV
jgi:hypothetical protein